MVKWSKVDFWSHGFVGLVDGAVLNAVFRDISCVLGFWRSCGWSRVNAVFRDISCVLGVFWTSDLGFGQKRSKVTFG